MGNYARGVLSKAVVISNICKWILLKSLWMVLGLHKISVRRHFGIKRQPKLETDLPSKYWVTYIIKALV